MHGDTDSTPEGRGTYGSRGTSVGGSAVFNAALRLKEKMKQIAAHMLEASPEDVKLEDGEFSVAGSPQKSVTFNAVAAAANTSNTLAHQGLSQVWKQRPSLSQSPAPSPSAHISVSLR